MLNIVIRFVRIWVSVLLLVVATRAAAQNSATSKFSPQFLREAEALRSNLEPWEKTLNSLDFAQFETGKDGAAIFDTLKSDRAMCLHFIRSLRRQISLLEDSAQKFPALDHLSQEVTTMWGVIALENCVVKLRSDLELALALRTALGLAGADDPQSVHVRKQISELRDIGSNFSSTDVGSFYDRLENQLMMHIGGVESELTQCRGPITHH